MRFFTYRHSILFAPEDPPDGGAGGGGGDGGAGDDTPALTAEDVAKIANAAVASQLKRLNVEGKVKEALEAIDIPGQLKGLAESLKPQGASGGDGDKGGDGKRELPPEVAKQFAKLEESLEAEKQARLAAEKERQEISERHQFEAGRQKLYEGLKQFADPDLHDVWVDHLVHNKRFKIDEDGTPILEVEYSPHRGMPKQKDFLALDEALPHLVQSADMKKFMTVGDGGSSGSGPQGRRTTGPRGARLPHNGGVDSKDPLERTRAQLAEQGIDFDAEFGG